MSEEKKKEKAERAPFSWDRLVKSNKFIFVLSLLMAIIIWVLVSPDRTMTISVPLNISTENTAVGQLGLEVVEGQGQKIDVEVEGKWYVISDLTESDIRLSVPFTNITSAGEQELRVTASFVSSVSSDIRIVRVVPETVKVTFDTVQELPFTITPKVNGVSAADGLVAGLPVLNEDTVYIKASKTVLNSIGSVVAEVDVDKTLSKSASYTVQLKVLDESGKEIDKSKLTMGISEVTVTQPINKSKQLAVTASFKNQPAYYSSNPISYSVSPSTINVVGDAELIDGIDSITLDPIDFSSLSPSSNSFKYGVSLPNGITAVDDVKEVTVKVDTSGIATKSVSITDFRALNVPEGKKVSATIKSKDVTVAGAQAAVSALSAADVYLQYDLSSLTSASGEHVVAATLGSSKYNNIWGVGKIQIQIKIE